MKQKIIKLIVFFIIVLVCSTFLSNVLCFKYGDGILQMENFYKEKPGSIDVICLGSSHTFCNISTKTLWEEFGIASYDLAGSVQPFWNSYYFLKEAILYQQPKLVVLDVFRAIENREYVDHSRIIKNTFGISSFRNRILAIWHSSPNNLRIHDWLAYPTYHRRYIEIAKSDFSPQYYNSANNYSNNKAVASSKGFLFFTKITTQSEPKIAIPNSGRPLSPKTEEYLLKIIELCKENCVPLFLCVTPYARDNISEEEYYVTVQNIAREKGVPFINFNRYYRDMTLDFSIDMSDGEHLNYLGAAKFTRYLGQYIKTHYNLPDHRGEENYTSYETMRCLLQWKMDNHEVSKTKELSMLLEKIKKQQNRYLLVVGVQGNYQPILNDAPICAKLEELGVSVREVHNDNVWVIDEGRIAFHTGKEKPFDWHMLMNSGFVRVSCDNPKSVIKCNLNREIEIFVPHGLSIVVYDKKMEHVVDRAGFSSQEGVITVKQALETRAV